MGQYKTNLSDTLSHFQVTNGHRESFHKKTVKENKWYLFITFWDVARAGDWIDVCPFVSVVVMIQMLHKDTAGRKSKFFLMSLKNHIISVGYTKDRRTMFRKFSLYVAKNIISSVYATQQTQRQCSEKQEERKLINCGSNDPCLPFYPIRCRQKWTLFHCQEVGLK